MHCLHCKLKYSSMSRRNGHEHSVHTTYSGILQANSSLQLSNVDFLSNVIVHLPCTLSVHACVTLVAIVSILFIVYLY